MIIASRPRIDPASDEAVHAALLVFPELAVLANEPEAWIAATYKQPVEAQTAGRPDRD